MISKNISRHQIASKTPPSKTKTYSPVAHSYLIDLILEAKEKFDLTLYEENYVVDKWWDRMVGLFTFHSNKEYGKTIAIGNSYDKSRAVFAAVGGVVFICTNGLFTGEYTFKRKHTGSVNQEVKDFINETFYKMFETEEVIDKFISNSKNTMLSVHQIYKILGELFIRYEILNTSQLNKVKKLLYDDDDFKDLKKGNFLDLESFDTSLWEVYNHCTEALKTSNSNNYVRKHIALHNYFNSLV